MVRISRPRLARPPFAGALLLLLLIAAAPARGAGLARPSAIPAVRPATEVLDVRAETLRMQQEGPGCLGCHVRHRLMTPWVSSLPAKPFALRGQGGLPYAGAGLQVVPSHPVDLAIPATAGFRSPPLDADGRPQLSLLGSTATGGTTTSLLDTTQTFPDLTGATVYFTTGANAGQSRVIVTSRATELVFAALPSAVSAGTGYRLDQSGDLGDNLLLDDGGVASYTRGNLLCLSCHRDHRSAALAGSPMRRPAGELCAGCHDAPVHSSAALGTKYGTWGATFGCQTCHQPHDATNAALVRSSIAGPDGQARAVRLTSARGAGSFADGDATYDGVCEICHTRTTHFRRDGSGADQLHGNFQLEAGNDCRSCHPHRLGFKAACAGCHMPTPATQTWPAAAGAHAKHVEGMGYACTACHSQANHNEGDGFIFRTNVDVRFEPKTFAAGTTIENGGVPTERDRNGVPTCYVGCHNPVVASPVGETPNLTVSVGWTDGTLACTACHDDHGALFAAAQSRHPVDRSSTANERRDCQSCHATGAHTQGTVQVKDAAGQTVSLTAPGQLTPVCYSCHDADGGPAINAKLAGSVEGYYSGLDWHGSRAGTGSGGTLKAPYARGQGPIACSACHDPHASKNPYLIGDTVNGQAVNITDKAGRGAETLCTACHAGDLHGSCRGCHGAPGPYGSGTCFTCHNHLGVVNFASAEGGHGDDNACQHCHGGMPVYSTPDTTPPWMGAPSATVTETTADVSWGTGEPSTSLVDYGLSSTAMTTSRPSGYLVGWHVVRLTGLTPNTRYEYVARSSDPYGNEARASGSFITRYTTAPSTPVLVDEGDNAVVSGTASVVLQWQASTNPSGRAVQYLVEVSTSADFAAIANSSGWITGTSYTAVLGGGSYYFRVQARDSVQTDRMSNVSATDAFDVLRAARPSAPTLIDQPDYDSGGSTSISVTLQWNAATQAAGLPLEYEVQLTTAWDWRTVNVTSPWLAARTWTANLQTAGWYWRVRARVASAPEATGPWSAVDSFTDIKASCPFVYVWDGKEYRYVTDIHGSMLGLPPYVAISKHVRLFGAKHLVLDGLRPDEKGEYRLKLRETLGEISYLDELRLVAVDHPAGYRLVSSDAEGTYGMGYVNPFKLWAVRDLIKPISVVDENGRDVRKALVALDGEAPPTEIEASPSYTMDFGEISPRNARLVIDGWSMFSDALRKSGNKKWDDPSLEALGADGKWVFVQKLGPTSGDQKTMAIDLSGKLPKGAHVLRLNLGIRPGGRWLVDRVALDQSKQPKLERRETRLTAADLRHAGRAGYLSATMENRIIATDASLPDSPELYGYGRFTRYGEVGELVGKADDRFAIMRHGDEIGFTFAGLPPPAPGMERTFVLKADVFYKGDEQMLVEPLPYHGMSTYPPPAAEAAKKDAARRDYVEKYNTREYRKGEKLEAKAATTR